jgi:hypothetical protein
VAQRLLNSRPENRLLAALLCQIPDYLSEIASSKYVRRDIIHDITAGPDFY